MKIDLLILAEAAYSAGPKLYLHGAGWTVITLDAVPGTCPPMAVGVRLTSSPMDAVGPQEMTIDVVDENGASLLPDPPGPLRGPVQPPDNSLRDGDVSWCVACSLVGVPISAVGAYAVVASLDGQEQARTTFRVIRTHA